MMKKLQLLLLIGTIFSGLAVATVIQAQQPGGLQPKFSADIKRDVAAFVKGADDASSQNTLQTNLLDLIKRTGTETRILAQIVSEAINTATQTPGQSINKVGRVIQIATYSTVSGALGAETSGASKAVETIASTVSFQFVSLSAKGDTEPGKNLMLVAQAIAFGVGVATLDQEPDNATTHLTGLAKGALEGTIRASAINNFDATLTTSFACQGLIQGMIQVASAKQADSSTALCQAISQGAYSGTIGLTAKSKPDQTGINGQAAVRGLLDGVFNSKTLAKLDSKALAGLAGSTYKGVKETLRADLPSGIDTNSLKEAAFDTWSTKMYTLVPGADRLLQDEIVASLFENSEGAPPLQVAITQGVIKVLLENDKAKRASELLPLMAEGAVASTFKVEQISQYLKF